MDREHVSADTRLMYCTTGVLKKMMVAKKSLAEWTHVVLDEVHEREEDMDFVILLCKKLIRENSRGVKLILMSATIDARKFGEYLATYVGSTNELVPAREIEIAGSTTYDVTTFYSCHTSMELLYPGGCCSIDFFQDGVKLFADNVKVCQKIINGLEEVERNRRGGVKGSVLVFLPGEHEIRLVKSALEKETKFKTGGWDVLVLHSRIPIEDIDRVFDHPRPGVRKVVLATNMAESSLTIPDVEYVIDFCLTKILVADLETNYVSLQLAWADRSSCDQRRGRAGRVQDGRVYRLVTKGFYDSPIFKDHNLPEMLRAPLDKVFLDTKLLDFGPPKELLALALDPPNLTNIRKTALMLKEVGAILTTVDGEPSRDDGDITVLGEILAALPIDIRLGKLIVYGHLLNVLDEAVIVAAGLSGKSIFTNPLEKKLEAYANKLVWADRSFSDCFAVLWAYSVWSKMSRDGAFLRASGRGNQEWQWCSNRYLQLKSLRDMKVAIEEINLVLSRLGIVQPPSSNVERLPYAEKYRMLQYAIFGAFYPNYFVCERTERNSREMMKSMSGKDPMTSVALHGFRDSQAKFGELYAQDVKDFFNDFVDNDKIDVVFDGSKVVVSFERTNLSYQTSSLADPKVEARRSIEAINHGPDLTGEISQQVYIAMKKNRDRDTQMRLELFTDEKAEQLHGKLVAKMKDDKPRLGKMVPFTEVTRVCPPGITAKVIDVEVCFVENPSNFWVQYSRYQKELGYVEKAIDSAVNELDPVSKRGDLIPGCMYLAVFDDAHSRTYYRARLEKVFADPMVDIGSVRVKVFYIDYGNVAVQKASELLVVERLARHDALYTVPAQALECRLAEVKPNPARDTRNLWDEGAIDFFKELVEGQSVKAEVYSVVPQADSPLLSLRLFFDDAEMTSELTTAPDKEPPYAVWATEGVLSLENHKERTELEGKSLDEDARKAWDEGLFSIGGSGGKKQLTCYPSLSLSRDCSERPQEVRLKGPHHPLVFNLKSAGRLCESMRVGVEPDSVNSVLLDRFPYDVHDQWMVAAHVGGSSFGSKGIVLRSTTFMPNQPGLGALLLAVFAPFVEMRCDPKVKRYTGLLAGLGWRPSGWGAAKAGEKPTYVSYNTGSDMEIQFEVNIDMEDVRNINELRYKINEALWRAPVIRRGRLLPLEAQRREGALAMANPKKMAEIQKKIRELLDALVLRKRENVARAWFKEDYRWNMQPKKYTAPRVKIENEEHFFLKQIQQTKLVGEELEAKRKKRANQVLEFLHAMAKRRNVVGEEVDFQPVQCPVCPKEDFIFNGREAYDHIHGYDHTRNFRKFCREY